MCGLMYKRKEALLTHMETEKARQTGQKSIQCELCNKLFWTRQYLLRHIKEYHSENGPNTCHICQKKLQTRKTLRLHIKKHDEWTRKELQDKVEKAALNYLLKEKERHSRIENIVYKQLKMLNYLKSGLFQILKLKLCVD